MVFTISLLLTFMGKNLIFQLNDVLAGELFTALKELGNFMTIEKTEY